MQPDNQPVDSERKAIGQLFRYLGDLNLLRNPVVRRIDDHQQWVKWLRELPEHPSIRVGDHAEIRSSRQDGTTGTEASQKAAEDDFVLRVRRPKLTQAPVPPEELAQWLQPGWQDYRSEVQVLPHLNTTDHEGSTAIVRFEDDPGRERILSEWMGRRDKWVVAERPARAAFALFEKFYELHGQLARESESVDLVLGDGILNWRVQEVSIHHPLVLQRLQLEFDPQIPQFFLRDADFPVELYTAPLRDINQVDGQAIGRYREELEKRFYHPLGGEDTTGFLQRLVAELSAHGQLVEECPIRGETEHPRMGRDPVIFVRKRTQGFGAAIDGILQDIPTREDFPSSLLSIAGIDPKPRDHEPDTASPLTGAGNDDQEILLSKPANTEQLRIAQRLERSNAVLVQGPPGTGKTHMVGNLIGHLLAQGNSVLVTSHTTKALRRVREQVIPELRPLCVSVLESDAESQEQLKQSVSGIVTRLSSADPQLLDRQAAELKARRSSLISRLADARERLKKARGQEYLPVVVAGDSLTPSDAARRVAEGAGRHNWIPAPVALGDPLPLSLGELSDLYRTNTTITEADETELAASLPSTSDLLIPDEFARLVADHRRLSAENLRLREDLWEPSSTGASPDQLESLLEGIAKAMEMLDGCPEWELAAIADGRRGGAYLKPWDELLEMIDDAVASCAGATSLILDHGPRLPEDHDLNDQIWINDQIRILDEIIRHQENGGALGRFTLLRHQDWGRYLKQAQVDSGPPRLLVHFQALRAAAEVQKVQHQLVVRWKRQMEPLGGPSESELGKRPELGCQQYSSHIRAALEWHDETWLPTGSKLASQGFRWKALLDEMPPDLSLQGDLKRHVAAALTQLPPIFQSRINLLRREQTQSSLACLERRLALADSGERSASVVRRLRESVHSQDPTEYADAFERLVDLQRKRSELDQRHELLQRLEAAAPAWAAAVRNRVEPHHCQTLPGEPQAAWLWRQLHDELDERTRLSLDSLQREIADLQDQLRQVTTELIDCLAWAAQGSRTDDRQRRSLVGWMKTVQRIGKGTGKRAPMLKVAARKLLSESRSAVPVWVMPLARVVDSLPPGRTRFDVVIIDEASQADAMALIALYMGKQVVIVGDEEQVSPLAVGIDQQPIDMLIASQLDGIPNRHLYDPKMSIYDLAQISFGATIKLLEHFRCVPDIIQFSNHLCYGGDIKPLRDASQVQLKPFVVNYRVEGSRADNKQVNEIEALAVASLLVAATEQPEYADKTFGVISLVGDDQAMEVDRLLRAHLSPTEYEQRRVVCGNPAHFQGDEREVVFLTLVDSSLGGPLSRKTEDLYKKRFNVAASRAQDQMWVVHSLDPRSDLRPGDLRRRLIEHAENPQALARLMERDEARAESEFERQVIRRLRSAGYRVTPQWKVGYYRIDMVVEGSGKRLAVECDGDRYHPLEKLAEDMERQAVLERLGWTFVRIRGSEFFRDPEKAMQPVFARLQSLEIPPEGDSADGVAAEKPESSELKDRVVRRAAELRREWTGEVDPLPMGPAYGPSDTVSEQQGAEIEDATPNPPPLTSSTPEPVVTAASDTPAPPATMAPVHEPSGAEAPPPTIQLPPIGEETPPPLPPESIGPQELVSILRGKKLKIVDKRPSGCLWVVGGQELKPLMAELKGQGHDFEFARYGGRATGQIPAWWIK